MLNVFTIDVEDYFHVEAFASQIAYERWDSFAPRVDRNVDCILEILAKHRVRATFFVLGWVAKKFPRLVRQISDAGHEIGSHGFRHKRVQTLTPAEFQRDIRDAIAVASDQAQRPIRCYRAPSFSIVRSTVWALDVLAAEGIVLDSSIFPVKHDLYGFPEAKRFPGWIVSPGGADVFEFPPSTIRWANQNFGVAGGGYLRLMPYGVTHWAIRHLNEVQHQPAMVYLHPWEIDLGQPQIRAARRSILRHYTNISTMQEKIERLLQNFQFGTFSEVCHTHPAYSDGPRQQDLHHSLVTAKAAAAR
jgi:polysaccharide deacetylase family protein (PEP-CTERM system associated)